MNKISNYRVNSSYYKYDTFLTTPNFKSKNNVVKEGSEIIKTSAPVLASVLAAVTGVNVMQQQKDSDNLKTKEELAEIIRSSKYFEEIDTDALFKNFDEDSLPLLNLLVEKLVNSDLSSVEQSFIKSHYFPNTIAVFENVGNADKETKNYLFEFIKRQEEIILERLCDRKFSISHGTSSKITEQIHIANSLLKATNNPIFLYDGAAIRAHWEKLNTQQMNVLKQISSQKDNEGKFIFSPTDEKITIVDADYLDFFMKNPQFIDKRIFELSFLWAKDNKGSTINGYKKIKNIVQSNPNISLNDLLKKASDELVGNYEITNPKLKNLNIENNIMVNEILYNIQNLLEGIDDKKVLGFVDEVLREINNSKYKFSTYEIFTNIRKLKNVENLLDIVHIANEEYTPFDKEMKVFQCRELLKKDYPDFWAQIMQEGEKNGWYGHFVSQIKYEKLFNFLAAQDDLSIKDYIYEEFYINKVQGVSDKVKDLCKNMYKEYGTAIFIPDYTGEKYATDVLNYIEKEFSLWKEYGKNEAIYPKIIDFTAIKSMYFDKQAAYGQGRAAGCAANRLYSYELYMCFPGFDLENIKYSLRHELTHINTGRDKSYMYKLDEILPKKAVIINGKSYTVPDVDKCKKTKTWQEFVNAGIDEKHIPYAYNNIREFIAVASEGDMSKYSEEFKNMLVDFGMPLWELNMPHNV